MPHLAGERWHCPQIGIKSDDNIPSSLRGKHSREGLGLSGGAGQGGEPKLSY